MNYSHIIGEAAEAKNERTYVDPKLVYTQIPFFIRNIGKQML